MNDILHEVLSDPALRARALAARERIAGVLRAERGAGPGWTGALSASALSTATAVTALELVARGEPGQAERLRARVRRGMAWLAANQNADGGWGDTTRSFSNISTTTLAWAALGLGGVGGPEAFAAAQRAEAWLARAAGSTEPERLVAAIERRYGRDRTFSIPILTMCALCGRLGPEREAWGRVRQLPFEIAALPQRWFGALRLPVVSYALPALIAIGQVRHGKRPTRNLPLRALRDAVRARTREKLRALQPGNGGFLEATPLTSFVTMSLAALGLTQDETVRRGVAFIEASERADGSWPIDTNLATWVTTLATNALEPGEFAAATRAGGAGTKETAEAPGTGCGAVAGRILAAAERREIAAWLVRQQYRIEHPYTLAAPGGWAWTNLPGGVPDADDTAGAVLALVRLAAAEGWAATGGMIGGRQEETARRSTPDVERPRANAAGGRERESESGGAKGLTAGGVEAVREAVAAGVRWLVELQNRDGGVPTFCRGWGTLPFDRSSPDITAHAVRAWLAARPMLAATERRTIGAALDRAVAFLTQGQRADGAWVPLWFGHQEGPDDENPLYGTARVLPALAEAVRAGVDGAAGPLERGVRWLVAKQDATGGWSGAEGARASAEETGLAVEALVEAAGCAGAENRPAIAEALRRGAAWLAAAVEREAWREPAPIGFYFAKLWYWERLYAPIFTAGALVRLTAAAAAEPERDLER